LIKHPIQLKGKFPPQSLIIFRNYRLIVSNLDSHKIIDKNSLKLEENTKNNYIQKLPSCSSVLQKI